MVAGLVAITLVDLLGSYAAKAFGFNYAWMIVASLACYLWVGYAAYDGRVGAGALAASIVAFWEGTVGWAISWAVGPGRVAPTEAPLAFTLTCGVLFSLFYGTAAGLCGAGIRAHRVRKQARHPLARA